MVKIRIFAWVILILLAVARVVFVNYGNLFIDLGLVSQKNNVQEKGHISFTGQVVAYPDVRDKETKIIVRATEDENRNGGEVGSVAIDGDIMVHKKGRVDTRPGDLVKVSGVITKPRNFSSNSASGSGDASTFDYIGYLLAQNIVYEIKTPEVFEVWPGKPLPWVLFRDKFENTVRRILPEPQSSLALGVLLGGKSSLGKTLVEEFRTAGILHMVVLSGYNVAVIITLVTYMLGFLPIRLRFICIIVAVIIFSDMVGGGSTVIRASIMALVPHLAARFGFKHSGPASLFFAGTIMVILNPYILLSDPSFHLSFLATYGILVLCKPILAVLKIIKLPDFFAEQIATTLAAQIWVTPYLLKAMGMLSLMTLVSNISTSSFVPPLMASTFLTGILQPIFPAVAYFFGLISHYIASYIFAVAHFVANIPYAAVHGLTISIWAMWVIYAGMMVGQLLVLKIKMKTEIKNKDLRAI